MPLSEFKIKLYSFANLLQEDHNLAWSVLLRLAGVSLAMLIFGWVLAVFFLSALEVYR